MHSPELSPFRQGRAPSPSPSPSFSSTLLDEIYHSIDRHVRFPLEGPRLGSFQGIPPSRLEANRLEENLGGGKALDSRMQASRRRFPREFNSKIRDFDHDHDAAVYSSSVSNSSDSSYGGFSSSDSDSLHRAKMKASCFAPLKLRPVKTHAVPARMAKEGPGMGSGGALFDGDGEEGVVPKSRTSKVYETLKKVRQQPVSAGGRLTNILNSIFTSSNKKKGRTKDEGSFERKPKSGQGQISTCSSATSFSRACRSGSFSSRSATFTVREEDPRDRAGTRSVRFSPVVEEDHPRRLCCRTLQHYDTEGGVEFGSSRARTAAKNLAEMEKKWDKEDQSQVHQAKSLEDIVRRNEATQRDVVDDDASSFSSSDLFEIDHLAEAAPPPPRPPPPPVLRHKPW
ncbi:hypothetical protein MLD38_005903 [Melastoma candidum]|uniref:Uncharacterized protein n=1 Tax=Melastoma candidum TaxID=119954 RepID=A0ACB9RMD5_9MYRT|nr:hypothetical protein MLD38_005903 [Melastoma candidum]